jgi:dienelactone hydrolase
MDNIFRRKLSFVILCALFLAMQVGAQQGPAPWKGYPPDYVAPVGSGPYPALMEADPSLPTHTIYHPTALDKFGAKQKLPIVAFANGACANVGSMYRNFLTEIASQGFLVIAIGPIGADMSAMQRPTPPPGATPAARAGGAPRQLPPVATQSTQLIDAVNWALAQNAQAGSKYRGKLDPNEIALIGQSCGGIQAIEMSADPRVKTTVVLNSGLFSGPSPIPGLDVPESQLDKLHGPVAYFIGGSKDVAFQTSEHNFPLIKVPVFKADIDVGHMATYAQPNGGIFGEIVGDWLKWQLNGDKTAGAQFVGTECGLCKDPNWTVERKGIF